ncbi:MAG: HopJ type III effector protein [Aestuariibaculum sp.]
MDLNTFKNKLKTNPTKITFAETIAVIETFYTFTPTAFKNGNLENRAGENSGSCKLLAFAKLQGFTKEETLACFGQFYFNEVLKVPNGDNHKNIRNFIKTGFEGLEFQDMPLIKKLL